jgi:hypothetical protein
MTVTLDLTLGRRGTGRGGELCWPVARWLPQREPGSGSGSAGGARDGWGQVILCPDVRRGW